MALDPRGAALALHRFGFGPRPGSIATIASDPTAALVADLDKPNAGQISSAGLLSSGAITRATVQFNAERTAKERLEARRREEAKAAAQAGQMAVEGGVMEAPIKTPNPQLPQPETPMLQNLYAETKAHFEAALHQVRASCDAESLRSYEEYEKRLMRDRAAPRSEAVPGIYR